MSNYYTEVESDFYRYLTEEGCVNSHSRQNYMSWLKFLSFAYSLSADLSESDIEAILCSEETARLSREKYTKSKDLVNFKSALRKYRSFLLSDFRKKQEDTILAEVSKVQQDQEISETERLSLTRSRVGQGLFRERLITYWRGCSVTSFSHYDILMASHIRPWKNSDNKQRLDVYNGLLLLPNLDKLFDKGYVSFCDNGSIVFSPYFPKSDRILLGLDESVRLLKVEDNHTEYLKYHRDNCLMA